MQNEILWTAAFLNERFTEPVSPLGWSFVGALFEQCALRDPLRFMGYPAAETIPAARLWHARPYVNVELFQIFYKPFPDAVVPADAVRYFPDGDVAFRKRAAYPGSRLALRFLSSLLWHFARDPLNSSPWNDRAWERFVRHHDAQTRALAAQLAAARDAQDVLRVTDATYALDARFLRIHRWSLTYADLFYKILAQWTGGDAQIFISGVPNITRAVNEELAALARVTPPLTRELLERVNADAPLNGEEKETVDALAEFLARHGHRSFSLDLARPTFREDPTQLLELFSARDAPTDAAAREVFVAARARATKRLHWWQRLLFPLILARARRYARLREEQRYTWHKSLALTRCAYLKLGADLAARGVLGVKEDVFYATRAELDAFYAAKLDAAALADAVKQRQREWAAYAAQERARGADTYPLFLRGDTPVAQQKPARAKQDKWRGRGVSPGVARGIARIVREPRDLGRVGAGEILVAPSTDPAWTPVFARLAGLALERGGILSHSAVVAREYHLPAVTAVADLTNVLEDGEWIEVDGDRGIVRRVEM